ncbi:MAG TPA: glutamate--tRNA ligase [bacterium]|nr:glutamate--tRNA ligase [bacterium]
MSKIRVRFAPSPTGYLHVGGARTALFNWLFARHHGGKFILRIEDTDRERSKPEYEEAIIRDLQWMGLDWDEGPSLGGPLGPYRQTERATLYREQLKKLLSLGNAYPCFCTYKELEAERLAAQETGKNYRYSGKCRNLTASDAEAKRKSGATYSVRLKVPEGVTTFPDIVRGTVTVEHAEIDDFILVRSGGEPTYNFVAAVDDALMQISHVIRGDDHLSNTPKQILIYQALGLPLPQFAHIPLILGHDGTPLSKRHGANSVGEFKRQGYLPEAMMNYLALLGWSLDGKTEIFSKDELIRRFSLERIVKSPARFDFEKLQWLNGHYIRESDEERIFQLCLEYLWDADAIDSHFMTAGGGALRRMVGTVKNSLKTISGIGEQLTYFLGEVHSYDPQGLAKYMVPQTIPLLEQAVWILEETLDFTAMSLEEKFRKRAAEKGLKFADLVHPMRLAITGKTASPNLFELVEILGKGRCIVRLMRFVQMIKHSAVPAN